MTTTATSIARPAATLDNDVLRIRSVATDDAAVVEAARRRLAAHPGDLGPWVVELLALAARSLVLAAGSIDDSAVGARLDVLARRVDRTAHDAAGRVERAVLAATDPDSGAVASTVRSALLALTADVRGLVAGEGAPLRAAVDAALGRTSTAVTEEIARQLAAQTSAVRAALSGDDPVSPFAVLRREVRATSDATRAELLRHVVDLRAAVEASQARDAMVARTSAMKGASYEEAVVAAATEVAGGLGDTVEPVGHLVGSTPPSKVGDAVAAVAERTTGGLAVRVVVEAKAAAWSSARWKREAAEARANRRGRGFLAVVSGVERVPGGGRSVFVLDPATVIVAWTPGDPLDLLAAAYQLVRAAAVADALREAGGDSIDAAELTSAIRAAHAALDGFDGVLRAEAATRRGLDELRRAVQALRAELERHLDRGLRAGGGGDVAS